MKASPLQESTSPLSADQANTLHRLVETLTPMQATWISGYLAGLNAALADGVISGPPRLATAADTAATLTVLYGSQTGHADGVARQVQVAAEARGVAVRLVNMADYKPRELKQESNLVVLVSTHGEGDPPDDAEDLHAFLQSNKAPRLKGLRYAVLALGDSSYEYYCQTGKDFDRRLAELGGERVRDRVDCDVDFDDAAEAWVAGVVEVFGDTLGADAHPTVTHFPKIAMPAAGAPSRKNPFVATLLTNQLLNDRGSVKETRHLELSSEESGLVWEPGDSLGVVVHNEPRVVTELIESLGLDAHAPVAGAQDEVTLAQALTQDYEITTLTRPFVEAYAGLAGAVKLKRLLQPGNRDAFGTYCYGRQVVDLVEEFPIKGLAANDFIGLLRKLPARQYSIASSHAANPDEVHLMVAAVRYQSHGRQRNGVASVHLAERVAVNGTVPVYVDGNKNFKLPASPGTPIIMIGPGTGVAPFRAFLEEREQLGASGRNWLFFGAPNFLADFYYQTDWLRWRKDGLLTRLDVAFSRDQAEKIYVQHRLLEQAAEVYAWLEEGAHVYVCGDAERMAVDVHQALLALVAERGGMNPEAAADYLKRMQKEKRYQRDVY